MFGIFSAHTVNTRDATIQLAPGSICTSFFGSRFRFNFGSCFVHKEKQNATITKILSLFGVLPYWPEYKTGFFPINSAEKVGSS